MNLKKKREGCFVAQSGVLPVRIFQKGPFLQMEGPHTLDQEARRRGGSLPAHASDCQAL